MKNTMKKPVAIPVEKLHPFTGHPFKVKDDEEMNTLIESIQTQGVLSPLIVRPIENADEYEIVTPSISILAQPSVAVVDAVVDQRGTRDVATEYLSYLYSDEAQRIAGDNFYRPSNPDILNEYADTFDLNINLVTIQDFGGWDEVQKKHFDDGGVFDRIYEKTDK